MLGQARYEFVMFGQTRKGVSYSIVMVAIAFFSEFRSDTTLVRNARAITTLV